ncbi:hypothetical protein [Terrisporobacter mayombei]|uniref:Arylsulfotransferase N-terminal domain-containing protein n=1 Tax=Terrisporobacter mayombei TaxID=1541 RepID=A0ABY9PY92_9FIRM|nr:hypothetical protein [Terrisporobacter mayombei]MCC3868156.1 hypothetical protein [Terrisporobacter mayombei]WMT80296.1 hypothetical protein TEMA_06100 [Terrisporobacter mayombei]
MNKNIGKKFLSVVCVGLLGIGISLFNLGKNNEEVEDLYGKRSELGDVNILLQNNKGMYETNEIKISNDDISIDYMAKQGVPNFNLSKNNIEGRSALEIHTYGFVDYSAALLKDDDRFAAVRLNNEYADEDNYELVANIKIKYDNKDKVESYNVSLGDQSVNSTRVVYSSVPISIDKDNLYIVTLKSCYSQEYMKKRENADYEGSVSDDFDKTELNLYKINLSSKNSKHILSKELDGKDIYIKNEVCFANKNKAYFLVNEKDKEKGYKSSLLVFDPFRKEIKTIDLGTKEDNIKKFSVEDNKLLLFSHGGIEGKNIKLNNGEAREILVDLESSKVEYINHIKIDANGDDILQVRKVGNKVYYITIGYDEKGKDAGKYFYYIGVFDENKNEVVYKGRIDQNTNYYGEVGIVKENEL